MATLTAPPVTFAREVPGGIENLRFPERSPLCARFTDHTHIECSPFELKGVPKPKYWFRDIGTSDQPLRWVNINAPTEQVLCNVAKTIGVSNGTMELILRDETPPTYFKNREACLFAIPELSFDADSGTLKSSLIYALITKNHLVTIYGSATPSGIITQIHQELGRGLLTPNERTSSNYLLTRIVGCAIHRNEKVLKELKDACGKFANQEAHRLPLPESRAYLRVLNHSIEVATSAVDPILEITHALREEESLFGMKPKDALNRYQALIGLVRNHVTSAQGHADQVPQDWDLNQDAGHNLYQAWLSDLAGLMGPPALAASIVQAAGGDWSSMTKWLVIGASSIVSVALVVAMRIKARVWSARNKAASDLQ